MKNAKRKSSGWRPREKRGTYQERSARQVLRDAAEFREKANQAQVWKACPSARCQRAHGCMGRNPMQCFHDHQRKELEAKMARERLAEAARPPAQNGRKAAPPPLSTKEAVALIMAAAAAEPPEPLWGEDV